MTNKKRQVEIMAPAGNFESLMAAIQGGANSVYFGVENLNMRSHSANNFTLSDLPKIVELSKEHDFKTYLTLNITIYNAELDKVHETLDAAKAADISAVIASDMSVIMYARQIGLEVHISTQLSISNSEALRFYAQYADVVVLARELNLHQVRKIYEIIQKDQIKGPSGHLVEIEMFAHGALCMSISGKCHLSLHEYGASANRGACYQVCRHAYRLSDDETGNELVVDNDYIMSPKDLCTIEFLDKMIDAGVFVLKIEGRARAAEYVKRVVSVYREAADKVLSDMELRDAELANTGQCARDAEGKSHLGLSPSQRHAYTVEYTTEAKKRLSEVFNRGFWDGYYQGARLGHWSEVYGSKATKRKVYLGKITNYFSNISVAEILLESGELSVGDDVLIMGPSTGVIEHKVSEIRVDLKPVNKAVKGDLLSIPIDEKLRRSDKLYVVQIKK